MKTQAYVLKNSLYVSWSSNGIVIVIVKQATVGQDGFVQKATFLHTQRPKKMILNCQSLKSHWLVVLELITRVSKTLESILFGIIMIRTNASAVPLTLFQFCLLHLKTRTEVQSWFNSDCTLHKSLGTLFPMWSIARTQVIIWYLSLVQCAPTIGYKVQNIN